MNRHFSRIVMTLGLAALIGSTAVIAQTSGKGIAEVPFNFQVQDRALPAGMYSVSQSNTNGLLMIRNENTGDTIATLAPIRQESKAGEAKLVFRCYSDRCFLAMISFAGDAEGYGLAKSRQEKEVAGDGKPGVLASIRLK